MNYAFMYITVENFGVFKFFLKNFMFKKAAFIWSKIQ